MTAATARQGRAGRRGRWVRAALGAVFLASAAVDLLLAAGGLPGLLPPEVTAQLRRETLLASAACFAVAGVVLAVGGSRPGEREREADDVAERDHPHRAA